jgi:hypothetical protein
MVCAHHSLPPHAVPQVHAEQFLMANLVLHNESALHTLAISAAPCGHCRQFYSELACAVSQTVGIAPPCVCVGDGAAASMMAGAACSAPVTLCCVAVCVECGWRSAGLQRTGVWGECLMALICTWSTSVMVGTALPARWLQLWIEPSLQCAATEFVCA